MGAIDKTKFASRSSQAAALNSTLLWAMWCTNQACAVAATRLVDTLRTRLQGAANAMDAVDSRSSASAAAAGAAGTAVTRAKLGLAVAAEELATALAARRDWLRDGDGVDLRVEPRYVYTEFWNSSLLWKSQVELLLQFMGAVESGGSLVQQLLMGQGKTQVLCPLLVLLLGDGRTLTTLVTPAELVPQLVGPLAALTSNAVLDVPIMRLRVARGCGRNAAVRAPAGDAAGLRAVPACLCNTVGDMLSCLSGGGIGHAAQPGAAAAAGPGGGGGGGGGPPQPGRKRKRGGGPLVDMTGPCDGSSAAASAQCSWPLPNADAAAGTLQVRSLRLTLLRTRQRGGVVVAPPEALKSLLLAFAELEQQFEQCGRSAAELGAVVAMLRTRSETHRSVAILDECDVLMHPLRSELNYPLGAPIALPLGDMRYKLAAHLVEAFLTIAASARSELVSRGGRVASVIAAYESAVKSEKQQGRPRAGRRQQQRGGVAAAAPGSWTCEVCTFVNEPGVSQCAVCRAPRPPEVIDLTSSQACGSSQASGWGAAESKQIMSRSNSLMSVSSSVDWVEDYAAAAATPAPVPPIPLASPPPASATAALVVHVVGDSPAARGAAARLQAALVAAADANAVMLVPYFELLSKEYYKEHIAGPIAELAVCWLCSNCKDTVGAGLSAWITRAAPPPGPRLHARPKSEPGVEDLPIGSPLLQVVRLVATPPCAALATEDSPAYSAPALRRAFSPDAMQQLLLAQSLVAAVLPLALRKQPRVHYGLLDSVEGETLTRRLLAVPFLGKDAPSPSSEFSHPDVRTVMTCLAYVRLRCAHAVLQLQRSAQAPHRCASDCGWLHSRV